MAVSAVRVVSIIGMMSALDDVIKKCGQSQIFHPDEVSAFYAKNDKFTLLSEPNVFMELLKQLEGTIVESGVKPELVNIDDFDVDLESLRAYVKYIGEKLGRLLRERDRVTAQINAHKYQIEQIAHFKGLGVNLNSIFSCEYVKVRFGRLPKESYQRLEMYSENPYVLFFPCTSDETYYWGVYFAPIEEVGEIDRIFAGLYFERFRLEDMNATPEESLWQAEQLMSSDKNALSTINEKIEAFWKVQWAQCMRFYTKLEELNMYFGIRKYVCRYGDSFILVGWIPFENEDEFGAMLEGIYGIEYEIDRADKKKVDPPVRLKNNWFTRPFEMFVGMYGLPGRGEIDPTPLVAITYTLLFGIMFGDLGQGLLLCLAGGLMWRIKGMMLGRILMRCGVCASIFGIVYGSVFGFEHVLDPIYKQGLGLHEKPIELMSPAMINIIILAAVGLGVVLVLVSMLLNIVSSAHKHNIESGIFGPNGLAGFSLYLAAVVCLIGAVSPQNQLFSVKHMVMFMSVPLALIFFREPLARLVKRDNHWKPDSWVEFVVQNVFELFEILLSYATNTISFLRVGAYALVHAGLMMGVFLVAQMARDMIGLDILYWLVVVLGNGLIIVVEGLLVGIQALRLEFYEIFSRFCEGQGRAYEPIVAKHMVICGKKD